jgi:hypothetical protein
VGPRYASRKSAGLSIVTLGSLQVWTVDPTIFHNATIIFPRRNVTDLKQGLMYTDPQEMPVVPDLDSVVVNNGEHDVVEIMDRVTAWATTQSRNPS